MTVANDGLTAIGEAYVGMLIEQRL